MFNFIYKGLHMKNIREMSYSEFREYLKTTFHYTDSFLDCRLEITIVDLLRLLEVNGELMKLLNLE